MVRRSSDVAGTELSTAVDFLESVRDLVLDTPRGHQLMANQSRDVPPRTLNDFELDLLHNVRFKGTDSTAEQSLFSFSRQVSAGNVSYIEDQLDSGEMFIGGFFRPTERTESPYQVSFEYMIFKPVSSKPRYVEAAQTQGVPIETLVCSQGFRNPRFVALFPENYEVANWPAAIAPTRVYYLIDRFVERGLRYTVRLLDELTTEESLSSLKKALAHQNAAEVLRECYSQWMFLHESGHHRGLMPLPVYLRAKASLLAGSCEETRADVVSLVELIRQHLHEEFARVLIECILAERLLRYPVQAICQSPFTIDDPILDYDSIGTQLILKFLITLEGIRIQDGKFEFTPKLYEALEAFCKILQDVELKALQALERSGGHTKEGYRAALESIERFVKQHLPIDITVLNLEKPRQVHVMTYKIYKDAAKNFSQLPADVPRKPK